MRLSEPQRIALFYCSYGASYATCYTDRKRHNREKSLQALEKKGLTLHTGKCWETTQAGEAWVTGRQRLPVKL